tara:strand:- start:786 stop:929 length:144 start_codon:yes stop_codon:yes gene_type:complete
MIFDGKEYSIILILIDNIIMLNMKKAHCKALLKPKEGPDVFTKEAFR